MTWAPSPPAYFIGWDVGGWNCDRNKESRDAIVILNSNREILGTPWRGNLREHINRSESSAEWLAALARLTRVPGELESGHVTLAIDTPLGFSTAFCDLITQMKATLSIEQSCSNTYLFRATELFLFEHGLTPLSAVKDMIGSQATKGMHVLAKFAPNQRECGVWSDGDRLTVIEAYPSACKKSAAMWRLISDYAALDHADKQDALTCALVALLFNRDRGALHEPDASIPHREGWIWLPKDALGRGV